MDHNNFNYVLETTGNDYRNKNGLDEEGNFVPHVAFKETNYFNTLQEAVEALLLTDIRKYEEMSEEANNAKYYEYACITAFDNNKPLLEIIRLTFRDAPDGSPPAGIYMNFVDSTAKEFEQLSGYNFSGFGDYDPGSPFLLLASYSYDQGFKITVDQALNDWMRSLEYYELGREFYDNEWKYKVGVVQNSLNSPAAQQITAYHYPQLPEAVNHLLRTEITEMDKHIAVGLERESWISDASLISRGKGKLVEFVTVRKEDSPEKVSEPGIHLKFFSSIKQLEEDSGIDLSRLGNYGQNDKYLLVANYNKDFDKLLPVPGYLSLLKTINKEQPLHRLASEQAPYLLQIIWEFTQHLNEDSSYLKQQQIHESTCSSLEEALCRIKELDERFFDEQQAFRMYYPLYVKQADIIDSDNDTIIISKFLVRGESDQLPAGIYMKLNEDRVSVKMLKLLHSHIKEAMHADSLQFLVAGIKAPQQSSITDDLQRKNIVTQRMINQQDNSGPRL